MSEPGLISRTGTERFSKIAYRPEMSHTCHNGLFRLGLNHSTKPFVQLTARADLCQGDPSLLMMHVT